MTTWEGARPASLSAVPGWVLTIGVLSSFAFAGAALGSASRPLFVAACMIVGIYAWRRSPADHLQSTLLLFVLAPFVRRLVDVQIGYDTSGVMLLGPLAAMAMPGIALLDLFDHPERYSRLVPLGIVAACVTYATLLTMFQGDWMNAASGSVKWIVPLVYAAALARKGDPAACLQGATQVFVVILPLIGAYGIWQYVGLPDWDRYWMQYAPILSVGQPRPFELRVFSTMNSPGSFASFTAVGLLLVGYLRRDWPLMLVLQLPAILGLLLSLYRTAWIALFLGIVFCVFFAATRRRSSGILIAMAVVLTTAAVATPFGDVIGDRIATLMDGSQDGSARERLQEYVTLWNLPDSSFFGAGFGTVDVGVAGSVAVDGMIISCWLTMGIVVGMVCLAALMWAIWQQMGVAFRFSSSEAVVLGALGASALPQIPLGGLATGEFGFLFWSFAIMAICYDARSQTWRDVRAGDTPTAGSFQHPPVQ